MKNQKAFLWLIVMCMTALLGTLPTSVMAESKPAFKSYEAMRAELGELFVKQELVQAAELLEWAMQEFPDHMHANAYNLGLIHGSLGNLDQGAGAMQYALDQGIFFGKWAFEADVWDAYQGHIAFQEMRAISESRLLAAEQKATRKLEVVLPGNYEQEKTYPLFIALHGGGENVEEFKPRWQSPTLEKEFIVAYVQSAQVASMTGFHWQNEEKTKRTINEVFKEISENYPIDPDAVYIGGFSSGGFGSLLTVMKGTIPVRGFVVLCPALPEDITDEMIVLATQRGVRGSLLTTELDNRLQEQKDLTRRMGELGLDVQWVVTPNIGHWYPENLGILLDEALVYIRSS